MSTKHFLMGMLIFLAFGRDLFGFNPGQLRTAKEIMGDELQELVILDDGSIIKGYQVLNRSISIFYNCDAGGFYSLEQGGFVGENVKINGFDLNGDLVLIDANIAPNAKVYDNAQIFAWARVRANAEVFGNAKIYGWATVTDNAKVFGNSKVYGWAWVSGNAKVFGDAQVYGEARIYDNAKICDSAEVNQKGRVSGEARVDGSAKVRGKAWVDGRAHITGKAHIMGESRISQDAKVTDSYVTGWARVYGTAHIYGNMRIGGTNRITYTPKLSDFSKYRGIHDPFAFGGLRVNDEQDEEDLESPKEFKPVIKDINKLECPICLVELLDKSELQRVAIIRDCSHVFHRACILDWLAKKQDCPVCRCEVGVENQEADNQVESPYYLID